MPPGHDYRSILTTRRITGSAAAIISLTRLNIIPFGIIQNTDGIHVFFVFPQQRLSLESGGEEAAVIETHQNNRIRGFAAPIH